MSWSDLAIEFVESGEVNVLQMSSASRDCHEFLVGIVKSHALGVTLKRLRIRKIAVGFRSPVTVSAYVSPQSDMIQARVIDDCFQTPSFHSAG